VHVAAALQARQARRRVAILLDIRREVPGYIARYVDYRRRARRDSSWLESEQVTRLSPLVGSFALEVVPQDEIGRFLYIYRLWDLASTRLLQRFLRSGMTVLDVGANIGYFSLLAARQVGPTGIVHSFEPHADIRARLKRNVALNRLTNIVVRPEAVTSMTGQIRFYRSAEAANQGISSVVEGSAPHGERREKEPQLVPSIRLDDVAGKLDRAVDLVKVDIEGAERTAFEGGARMFGAEAAPLLVFEAYDLAPSAELLASYGFTIRHLAHDLKRGIRLEPLADQAPYGEPNYVAYKKHHQAALAAWL
jgi:FkbM family methyltransferase